jgi:hypothetical protein
MHGRTLIACTLVALAACNDSGDESDPVCQSLFEILHDFERSLDAEMLVTRMNGLALSASKTDLQDEVETAAADVQARRGVTASLVRLGAECDRRV